jgi:hypothetical protein
MSASLLARSQVCSEHWAHGLESRMRHDWRRRFFVLQVESTECRGQVIGTPALYLKALGSDLSSRGIPQSLQGKAGLEPKIRSVPLLFTPFAVRR